MEVAVIGGGAAGFFAAVTIAEGLPSARVSILERGSSVLQKVKISGGGRCNVTHACFDPKALTAFYPRGHRELTGPFSRFGPAETRDWFAARGVLLKTEPDGRMFPVSDQSQTIIDCLLQSARNAGISIRTGMRLTALRQLPDGRWSITSNGMPDTVADRVVVATGSNENIWKILADLGHTIVPPAPSLFTFNTKDVRLRQLAGISIPHAKLDIIGEKIQSEGPLLITHWGLSGPAALKLSAWGARVLQDRQYKCTLRVQWAGAHTPEEIGQQLAAARLEAAKKQILTTPQAGLPLRLWHHLCAAAHIAPGLRWADINNTTLKALTLQLTQCELAISGKSAFKEEFVTAGGVDLKEINFKTFESRLFKGLYFAGEVLNVDAVTGGFNFQAAWTGGWIAGQSITADAMQE